MRVFLDANVIFSASNKGSNVERLVALIIERGAAITSDLALEEARRNILAKRPDWAESFKTIPLRIEQVSSVSFPLGVPLAEKDVPLLCSAIHGKCDYFVTGDKRDFGHLFNTTVSGVRVITLLGMAEIILGEN